MHTRAAIAALALTTLTDLASANTIIVQLVPSSDPDAVVYCSMHMEGRQISAIATKGRGLQNLRPFHWWANAAEDQALMHSLAGFLSGDLPSANPQHMPLMQPPYLTVDWFAKTNGSITSGRYQQSGIQLPAPLQRLMATVMPDSYCTQAPNS